MRLAKGETVFCALVHSVFDVSFVCGPPYIFGSLAAGGGDCAPVGCGTRPQLLGSVRNTNQSVDETQSARFCLCLGPQVVFADVRNVGQPLSLGPYSDAGSPNGFYGTSGRPRHFVDFLSSMDQWFGGTGSDASGTTMDPLACSEMGFSAALMLLSLTFC